MPALLRNTRLDLDLYLKDKIVTCATKRRNVNFAAEVIDVLCNNITDTSTGFIFDLKSYKNKNQISLYVDNNSVSLADLP